MSQENVELVQRGLGHLAATGEVLWETAHPDLEIHDHDTPDQSDYRGYEGLTRWLEEWGAAWAEWSIELDEFIDADGRDLHPNEGKGARQRHRVDRPDALVYRISGGLIAQIDYFNDRDEAPKAVGLEE